MQALQWSHRSHARPWRLRSTVAAALCAVVLLAAAAPAPLHVAHAASPVDGEEAASGGRKAGVSTGASVVSGGWVPTTGGEPMPRMLGTCQSNIHDDMSAVEVCVAAAVSAAVLGEEACSAIHHVDWCD